MEAIIEIPENLVRKNKIPERHQKNIERAYYLLKNEGCEKVYLFGSMVTGKIHNNSDIDIGIKGIPKGKFIRAHAELLENLDVEFDLVNFDFDYQLFNLLDKLGEVIEIG